MALSMVCAQKTPGFLRFVNQETSQHDPLTPRGFVGEWLRLSNFCCGLMAPGWVKKHASTNQRCQDFVGAMFVQLDELFLAS